MYNHAEHVCYVKTHKYKYLQSASYLFLYIKNKEQ